MTVVADVSQSKQSRLSDRVKTAIRSRRSKGIFLLILFTATLFVSDLWQSAPVKMPPTSYQLCQTIGQ